MTADNPNARSQSARRQRLTAAAQMSGFATIDQLAKAILNDEAKVTVWDEDYLRWLQLDELTGSEQANVLVREDGER
jgi:hypothetical protein